MSKNDNTTFPWSDPNLSPEEKAKKLVEAMTLDQKIQQLHGSMETINIYGLDMDELAKLPPDEYEERMVQLRILRHVKGNEDLGIPRFRITNGPVGVGMGDGYPSPKATALPMTIGLAASFDADLAYEYGDIIGSETATLGQHVLEGPGVCLHRTPIAGRNFEYFSEDPYLSGVMGVEVTKAIQKHDVIAMGKHYAVNDQEYERFRVNVEADEHVLRELYLLPFEMLVKDGDIAAIMSAYNRFRGHYASESRYLLNDILRKEWGFKGYIQSDFWSTRSCSASLTSGLDHEMPDGKWFNETNIKNALEDYSLEIETVDRALVRRYTQMFRFNQFDKPYAPGTIDAKKHGAISRKMGSQMAVLLKNEANFLPLDAKAYKNFLIVGQGPFADEACNGGGGSSKVDPLYTITPIDGMKNVLNTLGSSSEVTKYIVEQDLANLDGALNAAKSADLVVIMAGLVATEGADLDTPTMRNDQDKMVAKLLDANPNAVVVMKNSSPVLMPWIDKAKAVLEAWNQGSEDGHVVADLLFGVVNPSGKVPTTYAKSIEDLMYYDRPDRYPGIDEGEGFETMHYSEGLNMGYRWFQSQNIAPLFPFGYGLSYTTFKLSEAKVSTSSFNGNEPIIVGVDVENTGSRAGAEVVQVYLSIPSEGQPPKRLVGFTKVFLAPGEKQKLTITIDPDATNHPFGVWDYATGTFINKPGNYTVYIGTSSEDTPFKENIELR